MRRASRRSPRAPASTSSASAGWTRTPADLCGARCGGSGASRTDELVPERADRFRWAAFTDLPFLFVLWRYWGTWMHYLGAVIVGIVYPISAWAWFDLGSMSLFAQIAFFAVTIASCVGGTALGILIADRLRRAGVGRRR